MHVKNLCFRHKKQAKPFFTDLNFHLAPGKLHALHGKNGTGKTVLLNILSGKTDPSACLEGSIQNRGAVLVNQRFDTMIADQFTFLENLKFARFNRFPLPFVRLKQAKLFTELIEHFHIDFATPAYKLSGGQRQILALLMVLQRKAKILLLDEPTATLDEQNAQMVFEFLHKLQDITLLVVCHDKDLISRYTTGSHYTLIRNSSGLRTLAIN